MPLTALALCSRALLKIGALPLASFDDGSVESELAGNLYPTVRDGLLSAHPWKFATGQISLPQLQAAPVADFAKAFLLPADFLRALSAGPGPSGAGLVYRIVENRLHTNADSVVLSYIFLPDERNFPAFFNQALIARLAAEFCMPLTESTSRAQMLYRIAEEELRLARLVDMQQDMPRALTSFPLVEVRR